MGEAEKYTTIAESYRHEIAAGHLSVGTKMPTIRELCQTWSVSRSTAQRAISMLRAEGLVSTARRHGTVVAGTSVELVVAIDGPLVVFSTSMATATPDIAGNLGVAEGSNVLVVRMMHQRSGEMREGVAQE